MMREFVSDWYYLSIRNTKQIWRPLLALIPSLFIPIFFFLVNSFSFSRASEIPGFPHVSYRQFIAPVAIFTAIFFSSGNAGIELVQDISNGYLKKLLIMPINRLAIILGKLTEIAIQAVMQGMVVVVLLLATGIRFSTGVLGLLAIFVMLMIFAMAWSCVGMIFALRTQNARLVQSMFILVFPFLYITSSQMPRNLLPDGFRTIVAFNPVTYIIEGVRGLMLNSWNDPAIPLGFLFATVLFLIMITLTVMSFNKTLR
jgi:ABC-2 type transport system permease protein